MKTFKILGLLLTYPEGTIYSAADDIITVLKEENILTKNLITDIEQFLTTQKNRNLLDIQEEYVETFDRSRAHCLHLFEHIHGESRDRGQAMVDLAETYKTKDLYIEHNELPDYLPLFLEYLSKCPQQEAIELLGEAINIIASLAAKLKKNKSPYATILTAIESLSNIKADHKTIAQSLESAPKDPETLEELDNEWKEAEAFSGNPTTDCNTCNTFPNTTKTLENMVGGA